MISLLHSGKFWLKFLVFGFATLILLLAIDVAVLHYLFNAEKIQKHVDALVEKNGQQVVFDHKIRRSLFPRPTVTIQHLRVNDAVNHLTVAEADTVKIGLSWQSLLGKPVIEKLQISDAQFHFFRTPQGKWNLDYLWHRADSAESFSVNRLIVENSEVTVRDVEINQRIQKLNLLFKKLDNNSSLLQTMGLLSGDGMHSFNYQIEGLYRPNADMQWQDVKLNIATNLHSLGESTSQWNFDARVLSDQQLLQTGHVQWQWQSQRNQFHVSGTGQNWQISWGSLFLPQINGVATAQIDDNNINATVTANNTSWSKNRWSIGQFQIDSGWQNKLHQTALNMSGQLSWPDPQHWMIDNLVVNSHQDTVNHLPNSRFMSDLNGTIKGDMAGNGKLSLDGQFDNQSLNVDLNYAQQAETAKLSGVINLAQLNLRPYLESQIALMPENWQQLWQKWLTGRRVELEFNTNALMTSTVQLNQLQASITADATSVSVNPLKIQLYGGNSTGMLQIFNYTPLSWKTKQQAAGIQIKLFLQDLFGFSNLDGQGEVDLDLHSEGQTFKQSLKNISGQAKILMRKGMWSGIDINNILQHSDNQTTVSFNETNHTPFRLVILDLPINNSLTQNSHLQLHADNFDIKGNGMIKWLQQQMDYNVLVATRSGNKQNYLPLRINGTFTKPSFTIDYQRLTAGLHTPKQKQDSLRQTLQQQWQWLNQGAHTSSETNHSEKKP